MIQVVADDAAGFATWRDPLFKNLLGKSLDLVWTLWVKAELRTGFYLTPHKPDQERFLRLLASDFSGLTTLGVESANFGFTEEDR